MKEHLCRAVARPAAFVIAALAMIAFGRPAFAQQVQSGATAAIMSFFVRGVDTASHPDGHYFIIGGQGPIAAACLSAQGGVIRGAIPINATPGGYASFPRAIYSPHLFGGAGGFMAVWAEAVGSPDAMRQLFARPVSCSGAVGPPQVVSPTTWWEPGDIAIAYSPTSRDFLVTWQTPEHSVKGTLINLSGVPLAAPVQFSSGAVGRDPSVTWNPITNEFGVALSGETYSALVVVPAWNVGAFRRNTFNIAGGILTTMTDVAFNPFTGRYVMAWYELSAANYARIAEFDIGGNLLTTGVASTRLGSYDAFSMAFNQQTATFLLVGLDRVADTVLGLELNVRGFPFNGENTLSGVKPSRYPRVSASPVAKSWNATFSGPNFGALSSLIATSFASAGGPAGAFAAPGGPAPTPTPTPAPPPPPGGSPGCPGTAPVPGWLCINGGWVPPDSPLAGGAPPTPGSCPGSVPGMHCVNGNWVPNTVGTPAPAPTPAPPPPPPPSSCPGNVPGMHCVNGNWVVNAPGTPAPAPPPTPGPPPAPASCVGAPPVSNWVCAGSNWVPPDHPLASGGVPANQVPYNDGTCQGTAPVAGWVCIRGGWLPRDHPLAVAVLGG